MKSIAKEVGGRYDKVSSTITGFGSASTAAIVKRFQSAGFELFFSYNPEHPGVNLEKQWNNGESGDSHYYHVTVESSLGIGTIVTRPAPNGGTPESVSVNMPDPDARPKRITIHCDSAENYTLHHVWYDYFRMTWP